MFNISELNNIELIGFLITEKKEEQADLISQLESSAYHKDDLSFNCGRIVEVNSQLVKLEHILNTLLGR